MRPSLRILAAMGPVTVDHYPTKVSLSDFAAKHVKHLGIATTLVEITPILDAFGTYEKRDAVAKAIYPKYGEGHKLKITFPSDTLNKDSLNFFTLTTVDPKGITKSIRLNNEQSRGIIAATRTKHRTRMMTQHYFAERDYYLVSGTTNKSESVQGLFDKYGDRGVDMEPIAHLYKTRCFNWQNIWELSEKYLSTLLVRILTARRSPMKSGITGCLSNNLICYSMPGKKK